MLHGYDVFANLLVQSTVILNTDKRTLLCQLVAALVLFAGSVIVTFLIVGCHFASQKVIWNLLGDDQY